MTAILAHLWQSTAFVLLAALLAFLLRRNRAQARYAIWFAASIKFLIPFSMLAGLGARLGFLKPMAAPQAPILIPLESVIPPMVTAPAITASAFRWDLLLAAVWLIGTAIMLGLGWMRWMRTRRLLRASAPSMIVAPIEIRSSSARIEPGVFGILRPVLLVPHDLPPRLTTEQLSAILAHELCHVRRRDNLTAAIHMLVESIFWFHPLVFWIGSRLIEERELACDQEVLDLGNHPAAYAQGILTVCRYYLESPMACVSGITGSDLNKRIEGIMMPRVEQNLNLAKKLLLACAGFVSIAAPVAMGLLNAPASQAQSPSATAEPISYVASIKLNHSGDRRMGIQMPPGGRFVATGITVRMLITIAYKIREHQLSGGPAWLDSEHYDISAKPEAKATRDEVLVMLQSLLAERFKLTFRKETKDLPVYVLTVAKNGPKMEEWKDDAAAADVKPEPGRGPMRGGMMRMGPGQLTAQGIPVSDFADRLANLLGRNVIDKTGLTGKYNFDLKWTPDQSQAAMFKGPGDGPGGPPPPDPNGPSIFSAVQDQLGLKLEAQKGPVEVYVITGIEKPSEN